MIAGGKALARPFLLFAGLIAAGIALRVLPPEGASGLLTRAPAGQTLGHAAYLMFAGAALCAVGLPRQLVCYAAGLAFGLWPGLMVALAAQILGCATALAWARVVGGAWVARRLHGKLARIDRALAARPFAATLSLRLLPVGNNLVLNLAAGMSSVAALPFLAASALGYLPQTLVFCLAGSGVGLGHAQQVALAAGLLLASAALGVWMLRQPAPGYGSAVSSDSGRGAIRPR